MRIGGFLSRRGEIAVDEDRIGRIKSHRLKGPQVDFAAAGDADFLARVDEAEQTKRLQAALRREIVLLFEGRLGNRSQKIHGDRIDVHGAERQSQVDNVFVTFAHADDAARAGANPGFLDALDGRYAIVVGVGGDDLRMARAAGVEIVIDPADADFFQPLDFLLIHQAERTANIHAGFGADLAHRRGDIVDFLVGGTAAAVDDAEAPRAGRLRLP